LAGLLIFDGSPVQPPARPPARRPSAVSHHGAYGRG
jgi:hypothetical protein